MRQEDMERLKPILLAHLKLKPGMDKLRIGISLGVITRREHRLKPTPELDRLLKSLLQEGMIRVEHPACSETPRYYLSNQIKRQTKPANGLQQQVKSWTDPLLKGTYRSPQKQVEFVEPDADALAEVEHEVTKLLIKENSMSEKPDAISQHLQQHAQRQESAQFKAAHDKLERALVDLVAEGNPFSLADLCDRAGVSEGLIYNKKYTALKQRVQTEIKRLKQQPVPEHPPAEPTPDPVEELRQRIADLEQRNRELRAQLTENQGKPATPTVVQVALPLSYFQDKLREWQEAAAVLRSDLDAAEENVAAFRRMVDLHDTGSEPKLDLHTVQLAVNGNGKGHKS